MTYMAGMGYDNSEADGQMDLHISHNVQFNQAKTMSTISL